MNSCQWLWCGVSERKKWRQLGILGVSYGVLLLLWAACFAQGLMAQTGEEQSESSSNRDVKYKIVDIYITGLDRIGEEYILRYLGENGIRLDAVRSKKQLDRAAMHLANIGEADASLLGLELIYDYGKGGEKGREVYVEVLVTEMSLSFIPGGGNTYAHFGWANRIERKGRPSLIWLAAGYNRQDVSFELPYLWGSPLGFSVQVGHRILEHWNFSKTSRIRSNPFVKPELYLRPLTWLQLGLGLNAGLLYFFQGAKRGNIGAGSSEGLGLGPELEGKDLPGRFHGQLALFGRLLLDRDYLAHKGLGYHLELRGHYELLGVFAQNYGFGATVGLVAEPVRWFRPSLELRGDWETEGSLPLPSEVFSSKYDGYIRSSAELQLQLLTPIQIKDPIGIDLSWDLGAIAGFANATQNFRDINLERDLELSLFMGPEIYWGMPVNVRGQFRFGIIFREQFQKVDFAFNIKVS